MFNLPQDITFVIISPSQMHLSTRTQRPIEPSHPIHILPILRLLLLPHPRHIIPLHLRILRRLEPRKPHRLPYRRHLGVGVYVHFLGGQSFGIWDCGGDGTVGGF